MVDTRILGVGLAYASPTPKIQPPIQQNLENSVFYIDIEIDSKHDNTITKLFFNFIMVLLEFIRTYAKPED